MSAPCVSNYAHGQHPHPHAIPHQRHRAPSTADAYDNTIDPAPGTGQGPPSISGTRRPPSCVGNASPTCHVIEEPQAQRALGVHHTPIVLDIRPLPTVQSRAANTSPKTPVHTLFSSRTPSHAATPSSQPKTANHDTLDVPQSAVIVRLSEKQAFHSYVNERQIQHGFVHSKDRTGRTETAKRI